MNGRPEWFALNCLVNKPSLIRSETIDSKWFTYKPYQILVDYIADKGTDMNFIELRFAFDRSQPGVLSREDWEPILTSHTVPSMLGSWMSIVKQNYYIGRAREAANAYAQSPSDESFDKMLTAAQSATANLDTSVAELSLKDLAKRLSDRLTDAGEIETGIKSYNTLDNLLGDGIMPGRLITIGARPAVGKSAFSMNLVLEALKKQPKLSVDLFSLEMSSEEVYQRAIAAWGGIENFRLRHPLMSMNDAQLARMRRANVELSALDFRIHDKMMRLPQIVKTIRQQSAAAKDGYLAVIDYLQLVTVSGQSDRRLQIEQITREFKMLTQELNVPIVMLSQLSRGIENRPQQPRPMLSDLRESGSIEQDSNVVAFLFNADAEQSKLKERKVILNIAKNREGSLGDVNFKFVADKLQFKVAYLNG